MTRVRLGGPDLGPTSMEGRWSQTPLPPIIREYSFFVFVFFFFVNFLLYFFCRFYVFWWPTPFRDPQAMAPDPTFSSHRIPAGDLRLRLPFFLDLKFY